MLKTSNAINSEENCSFDYSDNIEARYRRAEKLMQAACGNINLATNTTVLPRWIEGSDSFWYIRDTELGHCYRLVDAGKKSNTSAFDHKALACALAMDSGEEIDPENLPLADVRITLSPRVVTFSALNATWEYDDSEKHCKKTRKPQ